MKKGEGKFLRHKKVSYYALVRLEIESGGNGIIVTTDCRGRGFFSQGYVEEAPAEGYDAWKQGAINGVRFALEAIDLQQAEIKITHIEGLTTDTNPIIVAAAAARAVWNALDVSIAEETEKNMQDYVLQSWTHDSSFVPTDNFLISK